MADSKEQNVPKGLAEAKAKDDFNKAAKKEQEQKAQTEKGKSVASQVQINQLEQQRPKKEFTQELTPTGSKTKEVNEAVFKEKNAQIDRQVNDFRERMKAQKGKSKEAFERAASKDKERSR